MLIALDERRHHSELSRPMRVDRMAECLTRRHAGRLCTGVPRNGSGRQRPACRPERALEPTGNGRQRSPDASGDRPSRCRRCGDPCSVGDLAPVTGAEVPPTQVWTRLRPRSRAAWRSSTESCVARRIHQPTQQQHCRGTTALSPAGPHPLDAPMVASIPVALHPRRARLPSAYHSRGGTRTRDPGIMSAVL